MKFYKKHYTRKANRKHGKDIKYSGIRKKQKMQIDIEKITDNEINEIKYYNSYQKDI